MDSTTLHAASLLVWKIGIPITVLSGTFGNIMILLIEYRLVRSSGSSLSVYFVCLALLDLTSSWFIKIFFFLNAFKIFLNYELLCKAQVFLAYSIGHMTAALVVAMTFHRVAAVLWPLTLNNDKTAGAVVGAILAFFLLLNCHILYGHTSPTNADNDTSICFLTFVSDEYATFFSDVYGWVDTAFSSLLPFCLLLAANCVLVWKVRASLREARDKLTNSFSSLHTRRKQSSSMTVTLIAVSITFFVLTLPLAVYCIYARRLSLVSSPQFDSAAVGSLIHAVTSVMYFCNNSINFYVLCLTGNKYRSQFANIFCGGKV